MSGYRVEWTRRSPAGSGFAAQADHEVPAGRTGYVIDIAQLEKGAPYWMRVVAFNPVGDGEPSEIVQAMATSAPGSVTDLRADADDEQLALRWAAPRDSGGTAVTGYGIRYRLSPGGSWRSWPHDGIAASAVVTGLINGLTYELAVRAANDVGEGPWSSASAVPSLAALQPTGAAATAAAGGTRSAGVVDASDQIRPRSLRGDLAARAGPAPHRSRTATGRGGDGDVGGAVRSRRRCGIPGARGGALRRRHDRFVAGHGGCSPTRASTARGPRRRRFQRRPLGPLRRRGVAGTPGVPHRGLHRAVDDTHPGGDAVPRAGVEVPRRSLVPGSRPCRRRLANRRWFRLGQSYDLRLRAWNLDGPGAWSNTERVLVAFAPDPPRLGSPSPADEQMTLSWDPPSFTGGVPLTGYAVQYRPAGGDWQDHPHSGTTAGAVIGSLRNGRVYLARVAAVNAVGAGEWGATVAAIPLSTPGLPRLMQPIGGDAQISLSWKPPSDDRGATIDDGGLTIESYRTEYKTNADTAFTPGPTITPAPTDGADTTYETTIRGLTNGVTYLVRVIATNNRGPGPAGFSRSTPRGPPGEPRNLELTPDDREIKVSWQPPSHDGGATIHDGGAAIETYRVEWKADTDAEFTRGRTVRPRSNDDADTTYERTLSGLVNGVTYDVRVTATNNRGTGPGIYAQATALSEADQVRQKVEGHVTTYESDWPWLRAATDHLDTSGAGLGFLPDRGDLRGKGLTALSQQRTGPGPLRARLLRCAPEGPRVDGDPRAGPRLHPDQPCRGRPRHRRHRLALHRQHLRRRRRRPARLPDRRADSRRAHRYRVTGPRAF